VVQQLLQNEADVSVKSRYEKTALHEATKTNQMQEDVNRSLKHIFTMKYE